MAKNRTSFGIVLRMFCTMLLVALSFAHKPVVAAPAADLAIYVLPDGTVASLCLPDADGKQGKYVDHGCEACRIAASVATPMPPADAETIGHALTEIAFAPTPERFHRLNFPPNAPPRGPPAFPVSFVTA